MDLGGIGEYRELYHIEKSQKTEKKIYYLKHFLQCLEPLSK